MDSAYYRRISRRIWSRHPKRPGRFLFAPSAGLHVEPATEAGRAAYGETYSRIKAALPAGEKLIAGALVVDPAGRYVFCGSRLDPDFLEYLAPWVRAHIGAAPALLGLVDAGVARVDVDLKSDDAVQALRGADLDVRRMDELWEGLLAADAGLVAAALEAAQPGERLWLWIDPQARPGELPLLALPVAEDPDRHRMDYLIGQFYGVGPDPGLSGFALPLEDGRLQLVARGLSPRLLGLLARWAGAEVAAHPGLARLRGCQLVALDEAGAVEEIYEDPALWADLPAPASPAAAAAQVLADLAPGEDCWFWLSPAGSAPVLRARRVADDPQGEAFKGEIAALNERFAAAAAQALRGTARRLRSGGLLLVTSDPHAEGWGDAARALLAAHAAAAPGLGELASARLVQLVDGQPAAVLSAAVSSAAVSSAAVSSAPSA